MSDLFDEAEFRKMQENIFKMLSSGFLKEVTKMHKATFDAYRATGFNRKEALQMTINLVRGK